MTVTEMYPRTWRFDEEGVRFFLLEGDDFALLIDSGMQTRNARELAMELTEKPIRLANTHADMDHLGSLAEFDCYYMHPAESCNLYHREPVPQGEMIPVWDKDVIDLGGRDVEIISIPGHTPGSIALLDRANRALFCGDTVQTGAIFMFGPHREHRAFLKSLERLIAMSDRFDVLHPSHGEPYVAPEFIPGLLAGARRVFAGEAEGRDMERFGMQLKVYDAGGATILYDK